MKAYAFKTTDLGKTWSNIIPNDDVNGFARNIQEDYVNKDLLFLGTELGLYISINGGDTWSKFTKNVPPVAIHYIELQANTNDLVATDLEDIFNLAKDATTASANSSAPNFVCSPIGFKALNVKTEASINQTLAGAYRAATGAQVLQANTLQDGDLTSANAVGGTGTIAGAGVVVAGNFADLIVAEWGVDAVLCQGGEGGGHTGSVPTSLLLPQVIDAVDIPVIAAGGFHDGRGLAAALAWGADGIAMGTRFLLTADSKVPEEIKQAYLATPVTGTVVSTAIDGAPQRVIRTDMVDSLEKAGLTRFPKAALNALRFRKMTATSLGDLLREGLAMKKNQDLSWAQLAMAANAPMLTKATMVDGEIAVGILPTGQCVGVVDDLPTCDELIQRIVVEAVEAMNRLAPATSF